VTDAKKQLYYTLAIKGLAIANRKNPYWNQSDAMQLLNLTRSNSK